MVWLSFLAVLVISCSKLYKRKIKLLLMGHEIGVREKKNSYVFVLFWSVRTFKIGDKLLVFTDGDNLLCLGECVLLSTFLSVSEMKTFFSQMWVFLLY